MMSNNNSRQLTQEHEDKSKISNTIFGALLAISLIIMQDFISSGVTDLPIHISVLSFAIAIPCLACCFWINTVEVMHGYRGNLSAFNTVCIVGVGSDLIGLTAAFLHISIDACIVFFLCSCTAIVIGWRVSHQVSNLKQKTIQKLKSN